MAKSQAQIRRLQKRAAARGDEYHPPETKQPNVDEETTTKQASAEDATAPETNEEIKRKGWLKIVERLQKELKDIEESSELKAKDRRSAKRKVEAIASEEAGIPLAELLEWYENDQKSQQQQQQQSSSSTSMNETKAKTEDAETVRRREAAIKLQSALDVLSQNVDLKAKDRRSAKRKAEAIALEESGMEATELLEWYKSYQQQQQQTQKSPSDDPKEKKKQKKAPHDPYIAFVGQLSFDTTKEQLLEHILTQLKRNEIKVKEKELKIRILTDPKTKASRGMAFVEVENPEVLYGLLALHQTFLNGRRINIERSAGGKKDSESRKAKIAKYRKEQEDYFAEVVDSILKEYKSTGELREGELDEGVIALCKRHAGPVVRASVAEYIEKGGRDMDNPSAYLSFLLTKFASEGIREEKENSGGKTSSSGPSNKRRSAPTHDDNKDNSHMNKRFKQSSEFAKAKVDMSISEKSAGGDKSDISRIFPSARRGRGRGYM